MEARYQDFHSVGPGSLAGRYLRMFWQPVCLSENLKPGRPRPIRVLAEDFTLYRGESGQPYLVGARCPHRGLALAAGRVVGENIECFYHGWTFDGCGQCVRQPAEDPGFADKVRIPAFPTREYQGLVFAYLGEDDPPEFPTLDVFEDEGFVENRESFRPWPFFTQLENSVDETHFNFTHRRTKFDDIGMNDVVPEIHCEETPYGFLRMASRGNAVRKGHLLMPNWSLSSNYEHDKGWANHVVWRVPVDDETHVSFMADFIYKTGKEAEDYKAAIAAKRERRKGLEPPVETIQRILSGEMQADDVPADHPDIVMIQDGVACMGQGGRRDRSEDLMGGSDRQVAMLRRLWNRELTALGDGKPLTQWRIPKDLATTKGVEE
ncbi:MAG TPA: aromatic ring-hydroxylating dioxygenase subunit alpha [Alphaproteobacteria bacterium]|nr:aromatic ring-hydroxylating dioxygenase subunit alpha [Alphaproteobacteria bacterium]